MKTAFRKKFIAIILTFILVVLCFAPVFGNGATVANAEEADTTVTLSTDVNEIVGGETFTLTAMIHTTRTDTTWSAFDLWLGPLKERAEDSTKDEFDTELAKYFSVGDFESFGILDPERYYGVFLDRFQTDGVTVASIVPPSTNQLDVSNDLVFSVQIKTAEDIPLGKVRFGTFTSTIKQIYFGEQLKDADATNTKRNTGLLEVKPVEFTVKRKADTTVTLSTDVSEIVGGETFTLTAMIHTTRTDTTWSAFDLWFGPLKERAEDSTKDEFDNELAKYFSVGDFESFGILESERYHGVFLDRFQTDGVTVASIVPPTTNQLDVSNDVVLTVQIKVAEDIPLGKVRFGTFTSTIKQIYFGEQLKDADATNTKRNTGLLEVKPVEFTVKRKADTTVNLSTDVSEIVAGETFTLTAVIHTTRTDTTWSAISIHFGPLKERAENETKDEFDYDLAKYFSVGDFESFGILESGNCYSGSFIDRFQTEGGAVASISSGANNQIDVSNDVVLTVQIKVAENIPLGKVRFGTFTSPICLVAFGMVSPADCTKPRKPTDGLLEVKPVEFTVI